MTIGPHLIPIKIRALILSSLLILALSGVGFCQTPAALSEKEAIHKDAILAARSGDFTRALQLIQQVLKEKDTSLDVISDYIVILSWAGQCQEALKVYEGLSSTQIPATYVLPEVGRCYRLTQSYDKAIAFYQKFLKENPKDMNATQGLIYTYLDAGQVKEAIRYINEESAKNKDQGEGLRLYLADIFLKEKKISEAQSIYTKALKDNLANVHAQLGMGKVLIAQGKYSEAEVFIDQALKNDPKNIEALFAKAELLEAQREYIPAYRLYEEISRVYPTSQAAVNLKYRALMNMGANSLTKEKLEQSKDVIDPEVLQLLWGNEAMVRVGWEEPGVALQILDRNNKIIQSEMSKGKYPDYLNKFISRSQDDQVLALRQKQDMKEAVKEYEDLKNKIVASGVRKEVAPIPPWVTVNAADGYLYLEQPQTAHDLYQKVLEQGWDQQGNTRLALYYDLVELGRYKEATVILEGLDKEMPAQIVERGILQDNWRKENVAVNKGWLLLYQDRLADGQKYLQEMMSVAPYDMNIRTALAHAYLWRGWPRLAQEEFEIVRTIDPKDIPSAIGYCYSLDANDQGEQARQQAKDLLEKNPASKHVQKLNRFLHVEDMRTVTLDAGTSAEHAGADEFWWTLRGEQPVIAPDRKIFAEYVGKNTREDDLKNDIRRFVFGADWRLNRDWALVSSVSSDDNGDHLGYGEQLTLNPNDYLAFSAAYDSYSLDIPARARVTGVHGQDGSYLARYRASENFVTEFRSSRLDLSDGNEENSYLLRLDRAMTTAAYWKTRLALEGYYATNSDTDVPYFSPQHLASVYLVPMVEHVWFRRYEKAFVDRFYLGLGQQWQKNFSRQDVGYVRYEQDYKFSDVFAFLIGATVARRNYDGVATDAWEVDIKLVRHF